MTKDTLNVRRDDDFLVQHLVDPTEWVADHERALCNVCTRAFGTFRRKHHCRMCGEIVCSGCTLHKNAVLSTIGYTRVRVCISCLFNSDQTQKARACSPGSTSPSTISMDGSREWLSSHLHSPDSPSSQEYDDEEEEYTPTYHRNNQDTNDRGSPLPSQQHARWTHPWPQPPVPRDEVDRLEALDALQVLDSTSEPAFDMICDLAKARLSCPMAAVSFVDEHRQWFKASVGLSLKVIPRKIAFCAYTICSKEPMVVLDTLKDKRFECNPLVSGAAAVRFYAGAPIIDRHSGRAIGSVFVLDTRPRESCDVEVLERLAQAASEHLPQLSNEMMINNDRPDERIRQFREQQRAVAVQPMPKQQPQPAKEEQVIAPVPPAPSSLGTRSETDKDGAMTTSSQSGNMGESMEVLLMRLLTQNTETQQQLANQQLALNSTLSHHSVQIGKLMHDVSRMEAKIDAKLNSV
ncbi:hypothetical protein Poli38472_006563 [Pythium oligandrum]|uniref:FYVE-type domain-containing protein n=1 Tax=Pythium oligandrum TaxID=41045 RepID=A0A8K1C520_PYTOL|nr:hypothetical protein Poli38472_006563 [Pythium oligandrum]|eukprot:TMW56553.1 hypothetical protein Poli38472_006563 [Pythium oligandrum]